MSPQTDFLKCFYFNWVQRLAQTFFLTMFECNVQQSYNSDYNSKLNNRSILYTEMINITSINFTGKQRKKNRKRKHNKLKLQLNQINSPTEQIRNNHGKQCTYTVCTHKLSISHKHVCVCMQVAHCVMWHLPPILIALSECLSASGQNSIQLQSGHETYQFCMILIDLKISFKIMFAITNAVVV